MYKIEPHMHTRYVSKCGCLDADELADRYKQAGYDAVIVTDHYNRITFDFLNMDPDRPGDKMAAFLDGYYRMKEAGNRVGLRVFKGAELRFDECENDYLLYGYHNTLLEDPKTILPLGIAAFAARCRADGAILFQAHPYRKKCTPAIACYLDGIEVRNCNPRHENHNARALEYAEFYHLRQLCGSDCHRTEDIALGGILTKELPQDDMAMARLLRGGDYELMPVPEQQLG